MSALGAARAAGAEITAATEGAAGIERVGSGKFSEISTLSLAAILPFLSGKEVNAGASGGQSAGHQVLAEMERCGA